jgi:hypothetical protein
MFVVALSDLSGRPLDAHLPGLAIDLGTTAYELRLAINAGLPAVIVATVDEARAKAALRAATKQGFRALLLDRRSLVPSGRLTSLRDFVIDADGLAPGGGSPERLPYTDVLALVRAVHRVTSQTTVEVKDTEIDPARAILTGGLLFTKTTTREVTTRSEQRQQVLYMFRRSGAAPWILRERDARYQGLDAELRPTSLENFTAVIRALRARAPHAAYDERLATPRTVRGVAEGIEATDLLACLIARSLAD